MPAGCRCGGGKEIIRNDTMIPKKIHYCWFGRNPKPKLAEKCIKSWQRFCPDFEIIEWNEDNFDVASAPEYVRQAYAHKKWAFVTDYVRLRAMTDQGGVYMDTDVELVKPLTPFLKHEAFGGFETADRVCTAVMACRAGFPLFLEFMAHYDEMSFLNEDGSLNVTTNVDTVSRILLKHGMTPNGQNQTVAGLTLYPSEVFSPVSFESGQLHRTRKTSAIHWFSGSWYTEEERQRREELQRRARREKITGPMEKALRQALGEEGWYRWQGRLERYSSFDQIKKLPVKIVRKLLGKPNEE